MQRTENKIVRNRIHNVKINITSRQYCDNNVHLFTGNNRLLRNMFRIDRREKLFQFSAVRQKTELQIFFTDSLDHIIFICGFFTTRIHVYTFIKAYGDVASS